MSKHAMPELRNHRVVFQAGGATSSGPAAGDGHEIILQGFNWESWREEWYKVSSWCFRKWTTLHAQRYAARLMPAVRLFVCTAAYL